MQIQLYCSFVATWEASATPCTVSSLTLLFIVLSNNLGNNKEAVAADLYAGKPRFRVRNNAVLRTSGHEEGEESGPGEGLTTSIIIVGGDSEICASSSIHHVLSGDAVVL